MTEQQLAERHRRALAATNEAIEADELTERDIIKALIVRDIALRLEGPADRKTRRLLAAAASLGALAHVQTCHGQQMDVSDLEAALRAATGLDELGLLRGSRFEMVLTDTVARELEVA